MLLNITVNTQEGKALSMICNNALGYRDTYGKHMENG